MNRRSVLAAFGALPLARDLPVAAPGVLAFSGTQGLKVGDVITWYGQLEQLTVVSIAYASAGMRLR